jgi:hypothetical protein
VLKGVKKLKREMGDVRRGRSSSWQRRPCSFRPGFPFTLTLKEREDYRSIRERSWAHGFADRLAMMILAIPQQAALR